MIKRYLDYILYTRWLSRNTWIKEKKGLDKFECYLVSIWKTLEQPEEIKLIDVIDFIAYLRKSWLVPWSCNAVLDGVKGIFKYMGEILDIDVLDREKIHYIKRTDKRVWFFNKEEKKQILNTAQEWIWKGSIVKLRNKLLTYMFLQTGLRCHELAKIKVNEIWESLQIVWKWWKIRTIYLRKDLLGMINEYLNKRKRKSDYLFDSTTESHISEWYIRTIFNRMSKKLWFHIHPHKFRHTFATDLLHVPWCNIYNVAKLMGHSRITTTQIYLWVDDTELKNLQFSLNY
jgi:site-specific recombinase XerD